MRLMVGMLAANLLICPCSRLRLLKSHVHSLDWLKARQFRYEKIVIYTVINDISKASLI